MIVGLGGCVYKLKYSGKYVIVKCKTYWRSKQNIDSSIKYFIKNTPKGRNPNNVFFAFFHHILENPYQGFEVEVLCKSDNPFELLKTEFLALRRAKEDANCLNKEFEPYIPQYTQVNGKGSWINRGYYLNFMRWKQKFLNQSTIE